MEMSRLEQSLLEASETGECHVFNHGYKLPVTVEEARMSFRSFRHILQRTARNDHLDLLKCLILWGVTIADMMKADTHWNEPVGIGGWFAYACPRMKTILTSWLFETRENSNSIPPPIWKANNYQLLNTYVANGNLDGLVRFQGLDRDDILKANSMEMAIQWNQHSVLRFMLNWCGITRVDLRSHDCSILRFAVTVNELTCVKILRIYGMNWYDANAGSPTAIQIAKMRPAHLIRDELLTWKEQMEDNDASS